MKKFTIGVLAALLLTGCSGPAFVQSEADEQACKVFASLLKDYEEKGRDFLPKLASAQEELASVKLGDDSLAEDVKWYARALERVVTDESKSVRENLLEFQRQEETDALFFETDRVMILAFCRNRGIETVPSGWQDTYVDKPVVANPCFDNMERAASTTNSTEAEKYLKLTADACGGAEEWYQALRMHPYAMGFPDVAGNELDLICFNYPTSRACNNP